MQVVRERITYERQHQNDVNGLNTSVQPAGATRRMVVLNPGETVHAPTSIKFAVYCHREL